MIEAPPELMSFLRIEEERARNDTLMSQREAALDFYNGEPFGDEEEGRSQLVTRDVAEVVDQMVISILRTMVSGDKVVEFDDAGGDEELNPEAEQGGGPAQKGVSKGQEATEAVAYQFMRKQPGYFVLHDALKAGLLEKTGVIKTYPVPQPPKRDIYEVPAEALAEMEFSAAEPIDELEMMWRVAVDVPQPPVFRDQSVPNEEFACSLDARTLDESPYLAHITPKSLSQLVEMGFDRADVEQCWGEDAERPIARARDSGSDTSVSANQRTGQNRQVWLREEYVLWDLNDDGVSERICVHRVGSKVLSIEAVDDQPFSEWCPFPMQHRRIGQSLADKVMDIQRTNSVLLRNAMDSLYQALAPRTYVHEDSIGASTIDDLLTVRPNALIRWKGGIKPETHGSQDTSATAFQAIEFMVGQRESRTGITRHNQGLNPDTLNKTLGGMQMLRQAGDQVQEYVARNFAELVARIFAKRYRLMREFGRPFAMQIDGQKVTVDPTSWPEEMDMAIRVGLGSGRKDERIQYRMTLLGIQKEVIASGMRIVSEEHVHNSIKGLIADANLGNSNDYVSDPATLGDAPERPDPEMAKAQADAMIKAQQVEISAEEARRRDAMEEQRLAADIDRQRRRDEAEMALKRERAEAEALLAVEKQDREAALAIRQQNIEADLARRSAPPNDGGGLPAYRPGGNLDQ